MATRNHERKVMATYGLSEGDYERLYQAQGGRCFICQRATGKTKRLAVDHDHETGEVRGLLCSADNVHIGYLRHDPEAARRMMLYLRDPPARYILDHGKDDT